MHNVLVALETHFSWLDLALSINFTGSHMRISSLVTLGAEGGVQGQDQMTALLLPGS